MSDSAKKLKAASTHYSPYDWDYTRQHSITQIRYANDFRGSNSRWNRLRRGLKSAFGKRDSFMSQLFGRENLWRSLVSRYFVLRAYMIEDNIPDGSLKGGIITYWEEDGEYIQMMQPSVGSLVADFLLAEPTHPHAILIRKELDRISERYRTRIQQGEVDG